jgi:spoIIIJ-associated protein
MEEVIQTVVQDLLDRMCTTYKKVMITKDEEDEYIINIESDDSNILIGHHGENIYALQHILKTVLREKSEDKNIRVKLDIDNYRQRQEENILQIAERKVEMVRNTNQEQALLPMSPYFRRLIHMHLTKPEFNDITTESRGAGDYRKVVIKPL